MLVISGHNLLQVAKSSNVDTPNMDETLAWYQKIIPMRDELSFSKFGINNRNDFFAFYSRKNRQGDYQCRLSFLQLEWEKDSRN